MVTAAVERFLGVYEATDQKAWESFGDLFETLQLTSLLGKTFEELLVEEGVSTRAHAHWQVV